MAYQTTKFECVFLWLIPAQQALNCTAIIKTDADKASLTAKKMKKQGISTLLALLASVAAQNHCSCCPLACAAAPLPQ
jgi:hypothetical protein